MKLALENVHTVHKRLKDGTIKPYHYHRITKKRIEGEPGTLAFFASHEKASQADEAESDTFNSLIIDYFSSQSFNAKADRTKDDYRKYRKVIEDKFAGMPIAALNDRRIKGDFITWRDELAAHSPRKADHCLNLLKAIMRLAAEKNKIEISHVHGITNVYKSDRSDKIWRPEQIEAVFKVAKPSLIAVVIAALNTGQREGDLIKLKWQEHYRNGRFGFHQNKRNRFVSFEPTPNLRDMLDKLPRKCEHILTTQTGLPWNVNHLGSEMRDAKIAAGIKGLTFNDLRGTAVTVLWESGSNEAEIATITGHSMKTVGEILERYTSRTQKMSASAISKLGSSWIGQLSYPVN